MRSASICSASCWRVREEAAGAASSCSECDCIDTQPPEIPGSVTLGFSKGACKFELLAQAQAQAQARKAGSSLQLEVLQLAIYQMLPFVHAPGHD